MRDARLTAYAKAMRKEPSEPEQRLWLALRAKRFENVKFRRQKVIGRYIADFAARDPAHDCTAIATTVQFVAREA